MRDIVFLAIIVGSLPVCFFRPYYGVLLLAWLSYMSPHRLTWSLSEYSVVEWVAMATLGGTLLAKDRRMIPFTRETTLMIALVGLFTMTSVFALYPGRAWPAWQTLVKILLLTGLSLVFCVEHARLRALLLVVSLSVGFYGIKGAFFTVLTGGSYRIYGPKRTFLEDNNDLALGLIMVAPVIYFLGLEQSRKVYRWSLIAAAGMCVVSVIFTYSRGGFLGLAAVGVVFLATTNRRLVFVVLLVVALLMAVPFIPDQWFDRISTIEDYEEDRSAMGRINAWWFAFNLASDRPWTGGGFKCFTRELFLKYAPDPEDFHHAHSSYFEMLGEHGFPALFLFVAMLGVSILGLNGLRKRFRDNEKTRWVSLYAHGLMLSLLGYSVSGAFLGRAYFDLLYQLIAAAAILRTLAAQESNAAAQGRDADVQATPRQPIASVHHGAVV